MGAASSLNDRSSGQAVTLNAPSRNTAGYLALLEAAAEANPEGDLYLITDNLASHKRPPIQAWLEENSRVRQVFLPTGACWLNLIEAWWRLFRREAFAGQSFATHEDVAEATRAATGRLNRRAKPWVWGRPRRPRRRLRRRYIYGL
jgi:transposase